jgi:hypothetical protein
MGHTLALRKGFLQLFPHNDKNKFAGALVGWLAGCKQTVSKGTPQTGLKRHMLDEWHNWCFLGCIYTALCLHNILYIKQWVGWRFVPAVFGVCWGKYAHGV